MTRIERIGAWLTRTTAWLMATPKDQHHKALPGLERAADELSAEFRRIDGARKCKPLMEPEAGKEYDPWAS